MIRIQLDGKEIKELEIQERDLHKVVENNSELLLNCYLIKSEYQFEGHYGKAGGALDSLMIDKGTLRPVIVEYKMGKLERNKTAINQIVYYYDWIKDHQPKVDKFILSVIEQDNLEFEEDLLSDNQVSINWDENIRCIIIAQEFSDWDEVLLEYIDKINIELYTYRIFDNRTFDLIPATEIQNKIRVKKKLNQDLPKERKEIQKNDKRVKELFERSKFNSIKKFIDDWSKKLELRGTQYYIAFINPIDKTTLIRLYIRKTKKLKLTMVPIISFKDLKEKFPLLNIREDPYVHDLPIGITELNSEEDIKSLLAFIADGLVNYI